MVHQRLDNGSSSNGLRKRKSLASHSFRARLEKERACVQRYGHESTLLLFSLPSKLDGDRFSEGIVEGLRGSDSAGWLGQGEFGILLPGTGSNQAKAAAERLRTSASVDEVRAVEYQLEAIRPPSTELIHRRRQRSSMLADEDALSGRPTVQVDARGPTVLLSRRLPRWKRAVDIAFAGTGLLLLSPLLVLIALSIKLTSKGPVIYGQMRTGRNFRRFTMYKFRTMRTGDQRPSGNEMPGPLFKMKNDPRRTTVGKFLRMTSLDELPQLFNVLRGDMTLIGPRALSPRPEEYEPWQLRRFDVTPGIACRWQAENRGKRDFEAWMRSDLGYVDEGESVVRDAKILLRTIVRVVTCAGSR